MKGFFSLTKKSRGSHRAVKALVASMLAFLMVFTALPVSFAAEASNGETFKAALPTETNDASYEEEPATSSDDTAEASELPDDGIDAVTAAAVTKATSGTIDGAVYWWIDGTRLNIRLLNSFTEPTGFGYKTSGSDLNKPERTKLSDWPWNEHRSTITEIRFMLNNNGLPVGFVGTHQNFMFANFTALTKVDVSALDTTNAAGLARMFSGCTSLTTLDISNFKGEGSLSNAQNMFNGCTSLTSITLPETTFNFRDNAQLNGMFMDCSSLTEINNLDKLNVTNVKSMTDMFNGCSSIETLDLSSFGKLTHIINMDNLVANCTSLTELILDNLDNSNIGPTNNQHSINDAVIYDDNGEELTPYESGAKEYGRNIGLKSCKNLRVLSANNSKVWMVKNNKGLPGAEYYNAASDGDIFWWWLDTDTPGNTGKQLTFDSSVNHSVFDITLNKRDYVDLITDRDGTAATMHDLTPEIEDIPDREDNINIKHGDLNPNGAGFLAPGVYEVTDNPWISHHAPMEYTYYRISYIGEVPYRVIVDGEDVSYSSGTVYSGDLVISLRPNNTWVNTREMEWPTEGEYEIPCDIKFVYEKAAIDAEGERHDVVIHITNVTYTNLDRVPSNPGRDHNPNNYAYSNWYYRTVLQATKVDGVTFRNYLKLGDPAAIGTETSALSGGAGTNIDFTVSIDGAVEGSYYIFYSDDLDVTESQNWNQPASNDQCFDNLPASNAVYGVGGESFIVRENNETIWLAPHTGLVVVGEGEERQVVTTGSDPSTTWSEFAVRSRADLGGNFTWVSGNACSTYALKNTHAVRSREKIIVYDFSNRLSYSVIGDYEHASIVTIADSEKEKGYAEPTHTLSTDFAQFSANGKTIEVDIKSIDHESYKLGSLLRFDPDTNEGFEYEWCNIVFVPATNVHYEETFLNYTSGDWQPVGEAVHPVNGAQSSGTARQSGANTTYGYDDTYKDFSADSNGRSMHVKLTDSARKATANFTFTGDAFDVFMRMSTTTKGFCIAKVYNAETNAFVTSKRVDLRFFGETQYSVPVVHLDANNSALDEWGTYRVELTFQVAPGNKAEKPTAPDSDIYVDGIRIYNPCAADDELAQAAYAAATVTEANPVYTRAKEFFKDGADMTDGTDFTNGAIVIDVTDDQVNGEYVMPEDGNYSMAQKIEWGANNEVELSKGNGFAFKINVNQVKNLAISAKAVSGTSSIKVSLAKVGETKTEPKSFAVGTTPLYYGIGDLLKAAEVSGATEVYIVVEATGDKNVTIMNVKSVTADGSTMNIVSDIDTAAFAAAVIAGTKGDLDANGISITDAINTMRAAMELIELDTYASYCADVNGDGKITLSDALSAMRAAMK